jgi:1,4-alpha-glucan branching enzyme
MPEGYISIVLHAHLPYVRHPEDDAVLEENWLYEAISETYLPLLQMLDRLDRDAVPFRLTVSLSPTLAAMFGDELLQERYLAHLDKLIRICEIELRGKRTVPQRLNLARMYLERFRNCRKDFHEQYRRNLVDGFNSFAKKGYLELITSNATHAFFPTLSLFPEGVNAQIAVAVLAHRQALCSSPPGLWLPECGYYTGLEQSLAAYNLNYMILESHGLLFAEESPRYGVFAPITCPNGVAAFGRDPESSRAVWSAEDGYPSHSVYREFYRDLSFEMAGEGGEELAAEWNPRLHTGIKYYAVTGRTENKRYYQRETALQKAESHADHFVLQRLNQLERIALKMDRPPILICPFDAELFGHWWFEGPEWLEHVIRKTAATAGRLKMISPGDYLDMYPDNQVSEPCFSSWGNKGYAEVWIDGSNDWIYRHIHKATRRMIDLSKRFPNERGVVKRALNQAAREVLLSQASDWPFIMKIGTTVPYAVKRVREHIHNFTRIYDLVMANRIDQEWLVGLERKNNIFPDIDYRVFNTT